MVELLDLPSEVLLPIAHYVLEPFGFWEGTFNCDNLNEYTILCRRSLKSLRSSCIYFRELLTPLVFERLAILPLEDNAKVLGLLSSSLKQYVKHVTIYTAPDPDYVSEAYIQPMEDPLEFDEVPKSFKEALRCLHRCTALEHLEIRFTQECAVDQGDPAGWERSVPETLEYRSIVMQRIVGGLLECPIRIIDDISLDGSDDDQDNDVIVQEANDHQNSERDPSLPLVKVLTLQYLQNTDHSTVFAYPRFQHILAGLTELHVYMISQPNDGEPSYSIKIPELHTGFAWLQQQFLEPTCSVLTHLSLWFDNYWGFLPKFTFDNDQEESLAPLHFPHLQSLALFNLTFANDRPMKWILSHSKLRELYLEDCPILVSLRVGEPDHHDWEEIPYPDLRNLERGHEDDRSFDLAIYNIPERWHRYFDSMREQLPHLTTLGFGSSCNDGDDYHTAFRTRYQLPCELYTNRYMLWDSGIGPCQVTDWDSSGPETVKWNSVDPAYPDADEKDLVALQTLMDVCRSRSDADA